MRNRNRLFHYTTRNALSSILQDGSIKASTALIDPNERPAIWCSYNPIWEKTANKNWVDPKTNKLHLLNKQQTHERYGLVRFEVSPSSAPYTWSEFRHMSGISRRTFRLLKKVNHRLGINEDSEWRISFKPIQRDSWLSIEVWDGNEWQLHDDTIEEGGVAYGT